MKLKDKVAVVTGAAAELASVKSRIARVEAEVSTARAALPNRASEATLSALSDREVHLRRQLEKLLDTQHLLLERRPVRTLARAPTSLHHRAECHQRPAGHSCAVGRRMRLLQAPKQLRTADASPRWSSSWRSTRRIWRS